jgi:hypothetical protein
VTGTELALGHAGEARPRRHPLRRAWPPRLQMARMPALGAAITLAVVLTVTGCSSTHPSSTNTDHTSATPKAEANCKSSGCAVTRTTLSLPQTTVLYGGSCSAGHGSWFFNAIEGGGSSQLRPNYRLQWSFAGGATTARPSGLITVPRTKTARVTITLRNGKLRLRGARKPGALVTAKGTLIVKLSGPASSHSLKFIEKGLSGAEHRLGLVSPFDAGGHPLVVHIKHVKSLTGC